MAYVGQITRQVTPTWSTGVYHPDANAYQALVTTGLVTGLSANDEVFSMRSSATGSTNVSLIRIFIMQTTAFSAAKALPIEAVVARSYTVTDTGGTSNAVTAVKNRQTDVASGLLDLRTATTGALTAGTRTLDAIPYGILLVAENTTVTANVLLNGNNIIATTPGSLILAPNEGLVIRTQLAYQTLGVTQFGFVVEWQEVPTW